MAMSANTIVYARNAAVETRQRPRRVSPSSGLTRLASSSRSTVVMGFPSSGLRPRERGAAPSSHHRRCALTGGGGHDRLGGRLLASKLPGDSPLVKHHDPVGQAENFGKLRGDEH